ncbi:hypothetical protein SAMN04489726_1024 [Allokutzneria albata]|uniref:Uncharacterized protein n=1 Tax=Allokutzneria albata TaxID=211114 RepID=A0A1G9SAN2_ALLAB|nr:hypothetical protein SAMN04489726_1024 [Allokutzneria albata]
MGFWGTLVVCQSPKPVAELMPAGKRADVESMDDSRWPDPWRGWRVWDGLPDGACDSLAETGSVLTAEIYDSDGARFTAVSHPSGRWMTYLNFERVLSHLVLPPAPFDADGDELTGSALDEQNAAYQSEVAQVRQRLLATVPMGLAAAERASAWAYESGLTPASVDELHLVLDGTELFVEELFYRLLGRLGMPLAS